MANLTTPPGKIYISGEVIARVDAEVVAMPFEEFVASEHDAIFRVSRGLNSLVVAIKRNASTDVDPNRPNIVQSGALFASRVLRYSAEEAGVIIPAKPYRDYVVEQQAVSNLLVPVEGEPYDFRAFETTFAAQIELVERLRTFKHTYSRAAATTIFMLHPELLTFPGPIERTQL